MKHLIPVAMLAVFTASALPVAAETLKVSSYLPPKHTLNTTIEAWGAELAEKSGGTLTLELYPASQLGPVNRQFDMAASGAADIAVVLHSATPGRFPMTELAGLPLAAPSAGNGSAVGSPRLTELADEFLASEHPGTKILWMAVTPPLKVSLKSVEPTSLDVFKGLTHSLRWSGVPKRAGGAWCHAASGAACRSARGAVKRYHRRYVFSPMRRSRPSTSART